MKERIIQIIQKEGLSNAEFAERIGVSVSSLSHIFNGRNNPSLELVMRIHKACPYVNLNWLLYGEGQMEDKKPAGGAPDLFSQVPEEQKAAEKVAPHSMDLRKENVIQPEIRYIEKAQPKITEIRIFFDNGTYEIFKPEK